MSQWKLANREFLCNEQVKAQYQHNVVHTKRGIWKYYKCIEKQTYCMAFSEVKCPK